MAGDGAENSTPIVNEKINKDNLNFDELDFDKWKDQDNLVNFVKANIDTLKSNTKLINKCKDFFKNQNHLNAILGKKREETNLDTYYNSNPKDSKIWAVWFLLTALDGKKLSNPSTPTGTDVYNYFQKFQQTLGTPQGQNTKNVTLSQSKGVSPSATESSMVKAKSKGSPDTNNGNASTSLSADKAGSVWQEQTDLDSETANDQTDKQKESKEKLSEQLNNKRRYVLTDLGLNPVGGNKYEKDEEWKKTNFEKRSQQQPEVYQRTAWKYKGIYKFADNSADLIYISSQDEKIVQQRGNIFGMYPNQIYKFDENYKPENWSFKDLVEKTEKNKRWEVWKFIDGKPEKDWDKENRVNKFSWLANMNSWDMFKENKNAPNNDKKYDFPLGKNWKDIQSEWWKEEEEREEARRQQKEAKKKFKEKNTEETKQLKSILIEYELLDDIKEIVKMQNSISKVDENWKIEELKKENEDINKEYKILQEELWKKQEALQKVKWNPVAEESLNNTISELQKKLDTKAKKYNENKQKIAEFEAINREENLELWDKITKRKDFKKWGYWKGKEWKEWKEYKKRELLSEKQQNLVKKLENKIKEITEASKITEINKTDRKKFVEQLPLLTQVLESQKVLLNLGKDDSEYIRNDADQIVKNKEKNTTYTMDTYGRLIRNETKGNTVEQSFVDFTENNNSDEK